MGAREVCIGIVSASIALVLGALKVVMVHVLMRFNARTGDISKCWCGRRNTPLLLIAANLKWTELLRSPPRKAFGVRSRVDNNKKKQKKSLEKKKKKKLQKKKKKKKKKS